MHIPITINKYSYIMSLIMRKTLKFNRQVQIWVFRGTYVIHIIQNEISDIEIENILPHLQSYSYHH